jgi:mono/diheme cytochrome c family protein
VKLLPLAVIAAIGVGVSTHPIACFPRMVETPSVLPYEKRAPDTPKGLAPFAAVNAYPPSLAPPPATTAPPADPFTVSRGQVFYGYYCLMCHGEAGRGEGPVGRSYVPTPPALTTPAVQALSDYRLTQVMVTGAGHAPVLATTVPEDRRWAIVRYLRSLAPASGP